MNILKMGKNACFEPQIKKSLKHIIYLTENNFNH
nr:MAG TPA: hypothetical protein [Caudoviricetes sp.]